MTSTLIGLVTDSTPAHLEYGDYRGYVEIDADTGEHLRDVPAAERAGLVAQLGECQYSEEYDDLRPVLSNGD